MRSPIARASGSAATVGTSCCRYFANNGAAAASTRATSRSYWLVWLQPSSPWKAPRPGYSARYAKPNMQVIRYSHSHQRANGLLYSSRSPSQRWPVVSTCSPGARPRASTSVSQTQKSIETRVTIVMYRLQPGATKSAMVIRFLVFLEERQVRRFREAFALVAAPRPRHDAEKREQADYRQQPAEYVDVHRACLASQRAVLRIDVPSTCR